MLLHPAAQAQGSPRNITILASTDDGSTTTFTVPIFPLTNDSYTSFLNGAAEWSDSYHLYDDDMVSDPTSVGIEREGTVFFDYGVMLGYENRSVSITALDGMRYCNWYNNLSNFHSNWPYSPPDPDALPMSKWTETGTYLINKDPASGVVTSISVNQMALKNKDLLLFDESGMAVSNDQVATILAQQSDKHIFYIWDATNTHQPSSIKQIIASYFGQ